MRRDLRGQKFGRLTPLTYFYDPKKQKSYWHCVCDCGVGCVVQASFLPSGHTSSCGCKKRSFSRPRHGHAGKVKSATWQSWSSMVKRCTNANCKEYVDYGGRGITVCDRWLRFENFLEDMGEVPVGLSIGRIDNNRGYFKENCRWETDEEQANNKRNNHTVTVGDKTQTVSQWARQLGVAPDVLFCRMRRGWSEVDAVTTPLLCRRSKL